MGKSIGVLSLKGGVGKTSSIVALGDALSEFGKKVLLVDGNFSAPNLGLHLNLVEPEITLHHVLNRTAVLKDSIYKLENFDLIPASIFTNIRVNPFELRDKIRGLKRKYDIILLDSSPSLNEDAQAVMLASDEVFFVTTPDHATLSTTLKSIKLAKQRDIRINGLILNKVHDKSFELSTRDIENTVGVPVLAVIPYDVNILRSLSEFKPSTRLNPNSKASAEYKKLAGALIGEKYKTFSMRDLFKMTPRRHEVNREIFYDRVFKE